MSEPVPQFEYMKSPDGQDLPQKLRYLMKKAAIISLAFGTLDVFLYSHPKKSGTRVDPVADALYYSIPKGYFNILARYVNIGAPIMGAAAALAITTNFAGTVRKKDDAVNWLLGGAVVGAIYGIWRGKPIQVFFAAFYIGCFCGMFKHAKQNGYVFYPQEVDPQYGGVRLVRRQWSFIKDRPGNWTRGEE